MPRGVLSQRQEAVLRQLAPLATEWQFYLGGGTAVALHLRHRRSIDFDWFTLRDFGSPERLAHRLQAHGVRFTTTSIARGTLHGRASGVSLSFLHYPYRLLARTVRSQFGCPLASIRDLAAMKLAAIASRGAKKDFVDTVALGEVRSLAKMLKDYRKKDTSRPTPRRKCLDL
jgi:hypothetical protein